MKILAPNSIRAKLTLIVMATSLTALVLAVALLGWFDWRQARRQLQEDAHISARVLANNSTAALSFGDEMAAGEILSALEAHPNFAAAAIYNDAGRLIISRKSAHSGSPVPPTPGPERIVFLPDALEVVVPVELNGKILGRVLLRMDLEGLQARQWSGFTTAAGVLLATAAIAYLLATRLQRVITTPIRQLAEVSQAVAAGDNYSLRATKSADDEVGQLVDGFNAMLAQIETRDKALHEAQAKLEQRVAARTGELFAANQQLHHEVVRHKQAREESLALQAELERANTTLQRQAADARLVQEKLKASEEQFSKAFSASPVPFALLTRSGRLFVDVNDRFAELTGLSRQQLVGTVLFSIPLWSVPETRQRLEQLLADGLPLRNWECQIIGPDEKPRPALLSAEAFQLGGEPCLLLMTQDVSERVTLESQLRQAQKMEAIGQMAAGVAHDFNNLLTVIQGYTQLLQAMQPPGSIGHEALEKIVAASQRAAGLTSQLLTFSRKQVASPKAVDLNKVVNNVTGMLRPVLGEHIRLHLKPAAEAPPILADGAMLEQVIVNLAVNARDAMSRGGELIISTFATDVDESYRQHRPQARAGQFVCLQVSDTGHGMDAATLERIFEPFFTTKGAGKGTGLGLATVYGIVKQHRGWIEVASQLGVGTTFKVFLPAAAAAADHTQMLKRPASVMGGTETILVVEDESSLRELVTKVLRQYGYQVLEAAHGREALELWEKAPVKPQLLLTDMMMPEGVSGWELAQRIHAQTPEVKVLFTSGYSPELFGGDVQLDQHANFLPKPYHPRILASAVRRCLDNQRPEREIPLPV